MSKPRKPYKRRKDNPKLLAVKDDLGIHSDADLARDVGVSKVCILQWRRRYHIPAPPGSCGRRPDAYAKAKPLLGTKTDHEIARSVGVSVPTVLRWRRELHIPPYCGQGHHGRPEDRE